MPLPKSKATKAGDWAALLREELTRHETKFPPDSLDFEGVRELLKSHGVPCGPRQARKWIRDHIALGKVKKLVGMRKGKGRLVNAVRYVCA